MLASQPNTQHPVTTRSPLVGAPQLMIREIPGFPLMIRPDATDGFGGVEALCGWLEDQRQHARELLYEHGALLLRGFGVDSPERFEHVASAFAPELHGEYRGTSPRDRVGRRVFNASELPGYYPIPQHCEMSFEATPPAMLLFCCTRAPRTGGETPLVDFARVWEQLDPAVRARFEEGGIATIRNYRGPKGGGRFDPWALKRWHEVFDTTDRAVVEKKCRQQQFEYEWYGEDRLRLIKRQPAFQPHPVTGRPVWFNHLQVFHPTSAPSEMSRIYARTRDRRMLVLGKLLGLAVSVRRRVMPPENWPLHATYADGREIPDGDIEHLRDVIWNNLVANPWQTGDVVLIDNFRVAHGRLPYTGPREVIVAMA